MSVDAVKVEVFLDDQPEPIATFRPPGTFELDTTKLEDGSHRLRIRAIDKSGIPGIRTVHFTVRNGPDITVVGIKPGDVVEGKLPIMVNAYAGSHEENFEPSRAETPTPVPTWTWVLFLAVVAWAMWYAVSSWKPGPRYANTPTFGPIRTGEPPAAAPAPTAELATPAAVPAMAELGARIYATNCATCHQPDGSGLAGVFPPLKGNDVVLASDPTEHIRVVLEGLSGKEIGGVKYSAPMPGFANQLNDEQIAAVVNHERTSWGNNAPTVTAADVVKLRSSH